MKVLGVIAETGFGRVERVQLTDGTVAARKVFAPRAEIAQGVSVDKMRKRFAREVRVQAEMPKEFFVPVLQADLDADPPWFVMPLAEMTLEQHLLALKEKPKELLSALDEILHALDRLHALGYVHRDLKPSNILFHDGRWKLADLGLVLPMTSKSTKLTSQQRGWLTIAYCAPEQFIEFRSATPAADIFAFGCVLHDFFGDGGRVPCQRVSCPGALGAVIEKCTEADPKKRFKSVDGLRAALFDVLATPPLPAQDTEFTRESVEWAKRLADVAGMEAGEITALARFLRGLDDPTDALAVFAALTEERLVALKQRDPDAWTEIAAQYCEWAKGSFDFQYCDVVVGRLLVIYQHGSVEMKANAVLAAAQLGESHNRWYVMKCLLHMCGRNIDDNVAQRIAIEIRAAEMQEQFARCATEIGQKVASYHPLIDAVLGTALI